MPIIPLHKNTKIRTTLEERPQFPYSDEPSVVAAKSLEQQLDEALNQWSAAEEPHDYAYIAPITLTAIIPANVIFLTILLGTEIQSPQKETMTATLSVDGTGLRLTFTPYLFIDGLLNGRLFGVFLNFKTGNIEVAAKGLFGQLKTTIERELEKLLKDTLLDKTSPKQVFPYHPFEDPNLKQTLATLQEQIAANVAANSDKEKDTAPEKKAMAWPRFQALTLSAGIHFKEEFTYDFGVGQAIIPAGDKLLATIALQGDLNQRNTLKIPYLDLRSDGILIELQDKVTLLVKQVRYQHGGQLQLQEVQSQGAEAQHQRLAEALQTVLEELVLPMANEQLNARLIQLLEDKIAAPLQAKGVDPQQLFGLPSTTTDSV